MKEGIREKINIAITIINLVVTIFLGYLGYRINSSLSELQLNASKRTVARETKDMWDELAKIEQNSFTITAELSSAIMDYSLKTVELFNAFDTKRNILGKRDLMAIDPILMPAFLSYLGAYGKVLSIMEKSTIEFDNARLKFSPIVKELGITGWEKFFDQADEVVKWQRDILEPVQDVNRIVDAVINHGRTRINERELKRLVSVLGSKIMNIKNPPYCKGLFEVKKDNFARYEKDFKKNDRK